MSPKEFYQKSYELHEESYKRILNDEKELKFSECWLREDTVGAWTHYRRCKLIDPIINFFPEATWVTIGDGKYGSDAHYILTKNIDVLATDISDVFLAKAKEIGYINNYQKENAESLSFKDNSFDFVYCKESFHHFPRPMLALYEMIRIAKKAVIIFDANDAITTSLRINFVQKLRALIRTINHTSPAYFEEVGNYVYGISQRELEKVCMGIGFKVLAIQGLNDFYIEGSGEEVLSNNSKIFKKLKWKIFVRDLLCFLSFRPFAYINAIIFKEDPESNLRNDLHNAGYKLIDLPVSPEARMD